MTVINYVRNLASGGVVAGHGHRVCAAGEVACLSETVIAFARLCLCGSETAVAFAGEKWALLLQFSGTEVSSVSVAHCWGRAEVMPVSASPCLRVLCAKFFALRGLMWVRARKSSPCALKTPEFW